MGRAKLNMELITKEKSRNITFKKRKEGLMRKMYEFTTLCDVSACMIIYGPKQEKGAVEPEIWPQNLDEVKRIIEIYKSKAKDSSNKTFGLSDFFHDRKRKIEEELAKLRKKNMEAKYPTWHEFMNLLTESQLREFSSALNAKAEYVKARIEFLKRSKEGNLMEISHSWNSFYSPGLIQRGVDHLEVINQSSVRPIEMHHYPTSLDHQELHQNSMMMLLMNDNINDHCLQFGGASTSGNIQQTSYKRQVFYERGVVDPVICHSPKPLARYYAQPILPPVQVAPPPYVVMPGVVPPQLQFSGTRESVVHDQENLFQYQMKNYARAK